MRRRKKIYRNLGLFILGLYILGLYILYILGLFSPDLHEIARETPFPGHPVYVYKCALFKIEHSMILEHSLRLFEYQINFLRDYETSKS